MKEIRLYIVTLIRSHSLKMYLLSVEVDPVMNLGFLDSLVRDSLLPVYVVVFLPPRVRSRSGTVYCIDCQGNPKAFCLL